jgi:hypothetical protein
MSQEEIGERSKMGEAALRAYLIEYEQCQESYRFTYTTIWQAGSIFVAASAAILAIAASGQGGVEPLVQVIAPLPFLFWWLGIFRPMHHYGELKSERLAKLEKLLNNSITGLKMEHFLTYDQERKSESLLRRLARLRWFWRPRVSEFVNLIGLLLGLAEIALIWVHYF